MRGWKKNPKTVGNAAEEHAPTLLEERCEGKSKAETTDALRLDE